MSEKITLISALCIAIASMAGALVWVVIHWQKDKDKHIADKDVLIQIVKEHTQANSLLAKNLEANTEATKESTRLSDKLHATILESIIKSNKRKPK